MNPFSSVVRAARVVSLLLAGAPLLLAQSAPAPTGTDAKKDDSSSPQQLDRFVVTGSYIPSTETAVEAGASPIVRLDRKAIEETGYTSTAELLQTTNVANANSVPISNNATGFTPGASAISLRGLGPEATLVLINGRRVADYPVGAGGSTAFVDLNSIPLAAIDSIEVLKDGASALYGADAVAGVINIRLRRGIDGRESFVSYGDTTEKDSAEITASVVTGKTTDKLSALFGVNYYHKGAILNRDRAYSAVPPFLSTNSSPANLEVSRFAVATALNQSLFAPIPGVPSNAAFFFANSGADVANNGLKPASGYTYNFDRLSTYNFNETAMSYPEVKRAGAFGSLDRKVFGTDNVRAYADFSYQDVKIENQLAAAATGDFDTPGQVTLVIPARTANPILTIINPLFGIVQTVAAGSRVPSGTVPGLGTQFVNGFVQRLAAPGATNPFNPFNQDIADGSRARLAEFGNRIIQDETSATLFTAGLKGENVAGRWNFDASISYSAIRDHSDLRMPSATRFNEIVNAASPIFDSRNSAFIGTATPYNPFGYYQNPIATNSSAVINYANVVAKSLSQSALAELNFVLSTSELWRLPSGPVGLALGGDFRHEQLDQNPDALALAGDLVGEAAAAQTNAQRKIGGVFVETRLPIFRPLEARASVRYEKFFSSHREATVPKIALRYLPFGNQLTLRSSYSKGFREPSLYELYSSPISAKFPIEDPRDGFVEAEQPITLQGNRHLAAEKTDYFNAGFVWSPTVRRLKGFSLGVDYWRVNRNGTVEADPQGTVNRAFGLVPGGLAPGESIFLSPDGSISIVNAVYYNIGRTHVEGFDFSGGYQRPTDTLGRWELTTVWTLVTRFERAAVAGAPLVSVLGQDSTGTGDDGYLRWKGRVNLSWIYRNFDVYLSGAYTDGFTDRDLSGNPYEVGSTFITSGQLAYSFRSTRRAWLRDTKLTLGVRNLFDVDPPRALGDGGNSTGYPGAIYNAEGRFLYLSVDRKF
ncbi:MAG TPA: TonB-dependent receptor [Opitutaceae bacterium]|nr:TonB-dependent receptor [Opitutaceae bacterium]